MRVFGELGDGTASLILAFPNGAWPAQLLCLSVPGTDLREAWCDCAVCLPAAGPEMGHKNGKKACSGCVEQ